MVSHGSPSKKKFDSLTYAGSLYLPDMLAKETWAQFPIAKDNCSEFVGGLPLTAPPPLEDTKVGVDCHYITLF